ncbi:matrix extracellular phosphoglycoprotein isoform X2 [Anas platyrhynchos]|nr:ovocleidin-116 isoform X2 [Anas platyrhynchos]UQZ95914.1 ovocleidin-116 [Anas platyrhynchos]
MRAALLCLCLLGAVLPTPVPLPPVRASGTCIGQHRILLKGCNTKHGFYIFKYVYSFSTRRNQTQIKKEEADEQSAVPVHQPGKEEGETPVRGSGGRYALEDGYSPKPENLSTPGSREESHAPRPGATTHVGPTLASSEGSGDMDLVSLEEVNGGEDILLQSIHPGGPRGDGDGGDGSDGGVWGVLVGRAVTAGRERVSAARGAGDEGSGDVTTPGRGRASITGGMGTGRTAVSSVTEKEEDVRMDAEGVDEFAYIPDVGAITNTRGPGSAGVTQVTPEDEEVKIFIGRANIHMGEHGGAPGSTSASSEDGAVPTVGTTGSWGQPEGQATTDTPQHGDSVTSSPGGGHSTGSDGSGATTVPSGQGLMVPIPEESTTGDVTVTAVVSSHGDHGDKARGEGPRSRGRPAVTTGAASSVASSGLTTGDCSTTASTPAEHTSRSATAGQGGSGEVGTASPVKDGPKARPEEAELGKMARTEAASSPRRAAARLAAGRAHAGDVLGAAARVPAAPRPWGSPRARAQHPEGSKASASASAGGFGRLHGGRRLVGLAALERSRQLDQVRHADELHLHERALYNLGGVGGSPPVPPGTHAGRWSADSSQSSEGERGSRSGSGEEDGWGARRGAARFHHGPSVPL